MKRRTAVIIFAGLVFGLLSGREETSMDHQKYNPLTPEEERVIVHKGTERPFTGAYYDFYGEGRYVCKRCDAPLFRSDDKFQSSCGWPSFDDEIPGAVTRVTDRDGMRTEILCANCGAHLGHVFEGEGFTVKNLRHCVNSVSLKFIPADTPSSYKKAYFAGGCFWGVEHLFQQEDGVVSAVSGYMGGESENPTYEDVSFRNTGHLEAVEVTYDPNKVTYEQLARFFFEIHDPTQAGGQGPDIGKQYQSAVFYNDDWEKEIAEKLIRILEEKGYKIATKVVQAEPFWKAEDYHQDYYVKKGKEPYCHAYKKRF